MVTELAFVVASDWSDESRQHPAMKFMEQYTANFLDQRHFEGDEYQGMHTKDFTYAKSDGTIITGLDKAWHAIQETYGPFTAHRHRPEYGVTTNTAEGWQMIGKANIYFNMVGAPTVGETKIKDPGGNEWDIMVPGMFHFQYVKDEKAKYGVLLKRTEIASDSAPVLMALVKRGVVKLG